MKRMTKEKRGAVAEARVKDRPSRFDPVEPYVPLPIDHAAMLDKFDKEHGIITIHDENSADYERGIQQGWADGETNADTVYQNALVDMRRLRTLGKRGKGGTYITLQDRIVDAIMAGLPDLAVADPEETRNAYRQHVLKAVEEGLDEWWSILPAEVRGG